MTNADPADGMKSTAKIVLTSKAAGRRSARRIKDRQRQEVASAPQMSREREPPLNVVCDSCNSILRRLLVEHESLEPGVPIRKLSPLVSWQPLARVCIKKSFLPDTFAGLLIQQTSHDGPVVIERRGTHIAHSKGNFQNFTD